MRSTRSNYHYAIRYVKKNEEFRKKRLWPSQYQRIILEIYGKKCIKLDPKVILVHSTGNESISELFAHKYNRLWYWCYNTIQLNNLMKMNETDIMTKFSTNISPLINKHLHSVSINQLQYTINRLN